MSKIRHKISEDRYVIFAKPVTVYVIAEKDRKFIGIAKCDPRDEYLKSVGMAIAKLRAEMEQKKFYLQKLTDK